MGIPSVVTPDIPPSTREDDGVIPPQSYARLFLRFLRFGMLAWGGPVAQIGMLRQELVEEEHWISRERFNRVLAVYQVLPGPEAHELCVYFGMQARGRWGGILAGLGFMLPGFVFMLLLSWFYVTYGMDAPWLAGAFYGMQAVVGALIVRAVHRIGGHALHDRWLWAIACLGLVGPWGGVNFFLTLLVCGSIYVLVQRNLHVPARLLYATTLVGFMLWVAVTLGGTRIAPTATAMSPTPFTLFGSGLRSGLLTFGGAYTVLPYLQQDAVGGGWMTNTQFLDGVALSGILPAPLVIFGTFVGYLGGGFIGAVALTMGIFLPAFAFTLLGHALLERFISHVALHSFLDGVTAGVVGLITATTLHLLQSGILDGPALVIFAIGVVVLFRWKSTLTVPLVVVGAAVAGVCLKG